jgi:hypothetical protein
VAGEGRVSIIVTGWYTTPSPYLTDAIINDAALDDPDPAPKLEDAGSYEDYLKSVRGQQDRDRDRFIGIDPHNDQPLFSAKNGQPDPDLIQQRIQRLISTLAAFRAEIDRNRQRLFAIYDATAAAALDDPAPASLDELEQRRLLSDWATSPVVGLGTNNDPD